MQDGEGRGLPRPGTPARFKMRRMTFISRCLLRMRSRDFHTAASQIVSKAIEGGVRFLRGVSAGNGMVVHRGVRGRR